MKDKEQIPWAEEALKRVKNAPDFVRPGIYKLMVKRAKERGKNIITSEFLTEIRNESMMLVSRRLKRFGVDGLTMEAFEKSIDKMKKDPRKVEVIEEISDFIGSRTKKNQKIIDKFSEYLEVVSPTGIPWDKDSLDRLKRVPEHIRMMAKKTIEEEGGKKGYKMVTKDLFEQVFGQFKPPTPCSKKEGTEEFTQSDFTWTKEAREKIQRIPLPFIRNLVVERTEKFARANKIVSIDVDTIEKAEQGG